jgi:hypothetical protein
VAPVAVAFEPYMNQARIDCDGIASWYLDDLNHYNEWILLEHVNMMPSQRLETPPVPPGYRAVWRNVNNRHNRRWQMLPIVNT